MESAVDLSVILAIGPENFCAMLAGYQAIDQDFRTALLERNLPGLMGLLDPNSPAEQLIAQAISGSAVNRPERWVRSVREAQAASEHACRSHRMLPGPIRRDLGRYSSSNGQLRKTQAHYWRSVRPRTVLKSNQE